MDELYIKDDMGSGAVLEPVLENTACEFIIAVGYSNETRKIKRFRTINMMEYGIFNSDTQLRALTDASMGLPIASDHPKTPQGYDFHEYGIKLTPKVMPPPLIP